ncbi:M91 family zinc metallopeptidase [Pseudomonas brenneri]|uniref:M91 family zinc metallopeptidase n=1 Tax=Pseudomonas brenneri TaxID=129817 RepID=UPI00357137EF
MVISAPPHCPNFALSSPSTPTLAGNSASNPITIKVPSLESSTTHFTPQSKLTTDQHYVEKYPNYTNSTSLFNDNNVKITHNTTWTTLKGNEHTNKNNVVLIETGEKADTIKISQPSNNEVHLKINNIHYKLQIDNKEEHPEELHIKANGGDDKIRVDPRVNVPITIEGGKGRDWIEALGSGDTRVYGGAGNDNIRLGSGNSYAEGNDGNDTMRGGTGHTAMYGNNGNDVMSSGPGSKGTFSYMDGGNGNDSMVSESPLNVMHGGNGNDWMYSKAPTTLYTGRGRDTVISTHANDHTYYKTGDRINRLAGAKATKVSISNAGHKGLKIEGSERFKQQVRDDLEFFRNSPTARNMLTELDQAAERNGSPITIEETTEYSNYSYRNDFTREHDKQLKDYEGLEESPLTGFIHGNTSGSVATGAKIHHNPGLILLAPSAFNLYHELRHGYDGANGKLPPGKTNDEPNVERQAVGLEIAPPATSPYLGPRGPLNENALRKETGLPQLTSYYLPSKE